MRRLDYIFGGFFAAACAVAVIGQFTPLPWQSNPQAQIADRKPTSYWGKDYLPNLPVVDQNGKTYKFYDDLIKDKRVIINFIFASCSDICPIMTGRMLLLQKKLGDMVGRDVFIYSISIDPEHDDPKTLKKYADTFQVGPGWLFLTGKPSDIDQIRYKLGERSGASLASHRNEMLLGNAARGDWFKISSFEDTEVIAGNVRQLDPNWKSLVSTVQKPEDVAPKKAYLTDKPGLILYNKMCAMCHNIGGGDHVGPDLMHVSARRNSLWLTNFITNAPSMVRGHDPQAMELVKKFPAVRMPAMGVPEQDALDVLNYIEAESVLADERAEKAKRAENQAPPAEPPHRHN